MHRYKELKVWQESMEASSRVYKLTAKFPEEEKYSLTSQVRRSSVSIPSNIAEGAGRNSVKEFHHFLSIANGSACELETQLMIANQLNYVSDDEFSAVSHSIKHIQNMIFKLQQKLFENHTT